MERPVNTENDKRTNDILLGFLERPALAWFVRHMPAWVNSDMLTLLGLFGSILIGVAYFMVGQGAIKGNWYLHLASLGFFINWFGDSLDGNLARYRQMQRPNYGYYTDHSIDGITAILLFLGIGYSGIARLDVTLLALAGYLLSMLQVMLKTHATGVFEMTSIKIGPTELRVLAMIANTVIFFFGIGEPMPFFLWKEKVTIGSIFMAFLFVALLIYYIYEVMRTSKMLAIQDGIALQKRKAKEAKQAEKKEAKKDRA